MDRGSFTVHTNAVMELTDITGLVERAFAGAEAAEDGMLYLFNPHTTAGLTINEGADPAVKSDIITALRAVVPLNLAYRHLEGNSPAHVMATLAGSSLTLFVERGRLVLGTWQRIFFCEFDGPRSRKVLWRFV